ncbi:MAG TPA: HAD-IC family P-type ATPase, partial [Blastocatellia bacterium]|nr:HAD-IC family P-type ATPase [Blastocatellia bacterium]
MMQDSTPATPLATIVSGSSTKLAGLSDAEVAARFQAGQYNRPVQSATKSLRRILKDNLFSVFNVVIGCIILLIVAFYIRTRDRRLLLDIAGVFSVAFFNTAIAIFQEVRAKLALDKVNLLLAREAGVIRGGTPRSIPHGQIVLGDVVVLKRGDQAVVDGTVLESNHLEIDESLLTGESVPIEKEAGSAILSGSYCLAGNGYYEVTRLSNDTYASRITRIAQQLKKTSSPLQKQVDRIVTMLFVAAIVLCAIELALGVYNHQLGADFVRKLAAILIGLVPQGLVLMASVTFALGIYRISKAGAIVQAFNAIESFANVQVICMDKTGTLTQNRMTVRGVTLLATSLSEDTIRRLLGTYAHFSSDKNATIRALEAFEANPRARCLDEYPFSSGRKMSVLKLECDGVESAYALGALEMLSERANNSDDAREAIYRGKLENYRNLLFGE